MDGQVDGEGREVGRCFPARSAYLSFMSSKIKKVRPSDLPTKRVRAPDGTLVSVKVVKSDSSTLGLDFLAAFQSNVTRVRAQQKQKRAATDAA